MRRSHASADDSNLPRFGGQCARCLVPQLVAGVAAVGLDDVKPLALALQLDRHAVGAGTGKQALVRNFEQRIPIDRRIIFRSRGRARGRCGLQVDILAGLGLHLHRIDETVTANPHSVLGLGQIGYQVTPTVVCDDDLGEFGRKIGRLGDNPDTRFRSGWTGNHAAKVTIADLDRLQGSLLRIKPTGHGRREPSKGGRCNAAFQAPTGLHLDAPSIYSLLRGRVYRALQKSSERATCAFREVLWASLVRGPRTNSTRVPIVPLTRKAPHPILLRFLCQSPSKPELMESASDTMSLAPVQAWSKRGHHFPPEVTG